MGSVKLIDLIYRLKACCIVSEMEIMREFGLSPAEYNGIAALGVDEKINCTDISHKMNLSLSRASRVVDKMAQEGYLEREIDPTDRRKCTISLSSKGSDVKKRIHCIKQNHEKQVRQHLSEEEINTFAATLKKIIDIF